ncbi:hypothetical protein NRIC_11350 [Enterococcus florum]|uniref:DUF3021 domain-containing protein n=1 Tax=Enterococcus florum TaxID=2480627 RepID=A0A4P5PA45_9ENTE|nr:DUF3021 domain-containing protein [Enterococcus florum]GCF93244.1 hypothetical protein NRIC_11350 [Enterococcus florum]
MGKAGKTIIQSIGIGCGIFTFFSMVYVNQEIRTMAFSFIGLSIVIGLLSLIYEYEKIPLLLRTMIHLGGSFLAFMAIAVINQWFTLKFIVVLFASLFFLLIFFAIWSGYYIKYRRDVEQINQKLK